MRIVLNTPKVNLIVAAMRFTAMCYEDKAREAARRLSPAEVQEFGAFALALKEIADEFAKEI